MYVIIIKNMQINLLQSLSNEKKTWNEVIDKLKFWVLYLLIFLSKVIVNDNSVCIYLFSFDEFYRYDF